MNRFSHSSQKRGSALMTVMGLAAILAFICVYSFSSSRFQVQMSNRSINYQQALAYSEAGAELAMNELNKTSGAFSSPWTTSGNNRILSATNLSDNNNDVIGSYEVVISGMNTAEPIIKATGTATGLNGAEIRRAVSVLAEKELGSSPYGGFGVYSKSRLETSSKLDTDAYNSNKNNGVYDTTLNRTNEGNVGAETILVGNSSTTIRGSIDAPVISGSVTVVGLKPDGTANTKNLRSPTDPPPFPTAEVDAAKTNNRNLTGAKIYNTSTFPRTSAPTGGTALLTDGSNAANKTELCLVFSETGSYYIPSIKASKLQIICTAPGVKLYMDSGATLPADLGVKSGTNKHAMEIGEAYINNVKLPAYSAPRPQDFQITVKDGYITFGSELRPSYFGLNAPNSYVASSSKITMYGAITAYEIYFTSEVVVHVDNALLGPSGGSGAFARAWTEVRP